MANYKPDIEVKLNKEKEELIKDLPDFIYKYLEVHLPSISSELRTHIAYAKDIKNFLNYYSNIIGKEIKDITTEDMNNVSLKMMNDYFKYITSYKVKYLTKKGIENVRIRTNSERSKARKLAVLKKLYSYLNKEKLITNNVVEDMQIKPTETNKLKARFDKTEISDMYKEIETGANIPTEKQSTAHKRLKKRDLIIFYILAYTGIRVSELVSMDIDDINIKRSTITVIRKGNKIQEIPYPGSITEELESYLEERKSMPSNKVKEEYKKALFLSQQGKRITTDTVRKMLKKYAERTDIDFEGCHTLRRTLLFTLYNQTKDIRLVSKVGGHSVATASKYYADVDDERLRTTMSEFEY